MTKITESKIKKYIGQMADLIESVGLLRDNRWPNPRQPYEPGCPVCVTGACLVVTGNAHGGPVICHDQQWADVLAPIDAFLACELKCLVHVWSDSHDKDFVVRELRRIACQ